jgi:hypothetical protein
MPAETPARRIPETTLAKLFGPAVIAGGIAWIVHLARPKVGTMFDNDNVGPTVVFGAVALIIIIIGIFLTRSSMRVVAVEGPCPCCGVSSVRRFDKPTDPSSDPTPCGACIAYLRTSGTALREEALETTQRSYDLAPDQYLPALQRLSNRGGYKFAMPAICAMCGDPKATHKRKIESAELLVTDPIELFTKHNIVPMVGMAPNPGPPTEDQKNNAGLSHLTAPVCDKHTEKEEFRSPLEYSNGTLEFMSYRYYKAFCELNNITRAPTKRA